jgi:hypothetical protein
MKTCENCKFFDCNSASFKNEEGSFPATGWCRRNAPHPKLIPVTERENMLHAYVAEWPFVDGDNWCGEHVPKEKK